jgi:PadR family transcriptional regulator, regulatory protein PadR
MLGELEQIVLLAVLRVGDDAYGAPVLAEIERQAGREPSLATVHATLARLETKGFLRSRVGEPTPERGGRRKRHYAITPAGRAALQQSLGAIERMTRGLSLGWDPR